MIRITTALPLFSGLGCLAALEAGAQSLDYGALEALFGEPVTTSVTGSPQRSGDVPATMEIITAEDIRRSGAVDIPAILRHVTGVDVLRWTNSGADVGIRGYNKAFSSRLLVLVNGRQVYADHYGYTPWSSLPVEMAEIRQIEVVKGPNSALFGFNAVGGAINIITFSPAHDPVNYATVRGGTQDLIDASGARTFSPAEDWSLRISAGARRNEDFSTPLRTINIGSRRGDERTSLRLDSHYNPSPNVQFELEASYTETEQTNMVPIYLMAFEELSVGSLKGNLNAETRHGLIQGSLYRNWIDNAAFTGVFDGQNMVESDIPIVEYSNEVTVAQLQDIFKIGAAHTIRLSGEYRESEMNTSPVSGGTVFYDVLSAGAMWQWQLTETLTLTSALRRDNLELGRTGLVPEGYGLANSDWDRSLGETSYNAGLVWTLSDTDTLRLIAARGAQLPSLFDFGGNLLAIPLPPEFQPPPVIFVSGIPGLNPTTVTNYELAWDRRLPAMNADLRVAAFHGRSRDITANYGDLLPQYGIFSAPANIGDSKTDGLELSLTGTIAERWRWGAGYLYQDVDDEFAPQFPTGVTYTNFESTTPKYSINANLGWTRGPWEVDAYLKYVDRFLSIRYDDEFIFDGFSIPNVLYPVPSYTIVDARIAYRVNDKMMVSLSGQNLLDSEQRQTAGSDVERRLLANLTVEF
jgi:iron complex outermembrane receptor protein